MKKFRIEHDGQWYTAQAVSAVYVVSLLRVAVAHGDVDREVAVTRVHTDGQWTAGVNGLYPRREWGIDTETMLTLLEVEGVPVEASGGIFIRGWLDSHERELAAVARSLRPEGWVLTTAEGIRDYAGRDAFFQLVLSTGYLMHFSSQQTRRQRRLVASHN